MILAENIFTLAADSVTAAVNSMTLSIDIWCDINCISSVILAVVSKTLAEEI